MTYPIDPNRRSQSEILHTADTCFEALLKHQSLRRTAIQSSSQNACHGTAYSTTKSTTLPPSEVKHEEGTLKGTLCRIPSDCKNVAYPSVEALKMLDKDLETGNATDMAGPDLSALKVARLFAEQAKVTLSVREFSILLNFLTKPPPVHDIGDLEIQISSRLASFFDAEVALTGEAASRLGRPSGPKNAELGLILHCQSKKGDIGEFWDKESRTILLLAEKGFNNSFAFGFDWHWRAEHSARARGGSCPITKWPQEQRDLHNKVSEDILKTLPLRFLVVASACVKKHYRRTLWPTARTLRIEIQPGIIITFDLDFRSDSLRRIVVYPDHPTSAFFRPNEHKGICCRLDAALNFFLWLVGRDYNENSFSKGQNGRRRGAPSSSLLTEMHGYVREERLLQRNLREDEYEQTFLIWARCFLDEDPAVLLARGQSLAWTLRQKISTRIKDPEVEARRVENRRLHSAKRSGAAYSEY